MKNIYNGGSIGEVDDGRIVKSKEAKYNRTVRRRRRRRRNRERGNDVARKE